MTEVMLFALGTLLRSHLPPAHLLMAAQVLDTKLTHKAVKQKNEAGEETEATEYTYTLRYLMSLPKLTTPPNTLARSEAES